MITYKLDDKTQDERICELTNNIFKKIKGVRFQNSKYYIRYYDLKVLIKGRYRKLGHVKLIEAMNTTQAHVNIKESDVSERGELYIDLNNLILRKTEAYLERIVNFLNNCICWEKMNEKK